MLWSMWTWIACFSCKEASIAQSMLWSMWTWIACFASKEASIAQSMLWSMWTWIACFASKEASIAQSMLWSMWTWNACFSGKEATFAQSMLWSMWTWNACFAGKEAQILAFRRKHALKRLDLLCMLFRQRSPFLLFLAKWCLNRKVQFSLETLKFGANLRPNMLFRWWIATVASEIRVSNASLKCVKA